MIHLYQHRDLGTLADVFATLRAHVVKSSVLAADTLLVPNRGAARWLQARLAEFFCHDSRRDAASAGP